VSVCLCLVSKTRESTLEPTTPMTHLVHQTIVAHHRLTLARRYQGGYHPGYWDSPPVTDPRNASQTLDSQHRESEFIMEGDLRLVLLNGSGIRGGRKVAERPIRDSSSGSTLGCDAARREGHFFECCVTEDRGSIDSGVGEPSATM
jgi:hypothetical protein